MPTHADLLATALDLAERGMHVFPLKPGEKTPALHKDWENRATTDPARIKRCWAAGPFNIGIACGPSGLLVIDLDTPKPETKPAPPPFDVPGVNDGADALALLAEQHAERFPWETLTVTTTNGGMHLYFTQPPGTQLRNTAGRLGWLIDTRGHGGYVVGPGSTVHSKAYRTTYPGPPAPLPRWLHRLLDPPKPKPRPAPPPGAFKTPSRYAEAVLRGELERILSAVPGTRNDTLNRAAFTLGTHVAKGTLPEALAERALTHAAENLGGNVPKSLATIRSALADGQRKGGTR
ncbi:MAG TPA: bifunctional DNA primase/polymerase [Actinocrinis sp.]|nr:bifunctional DNA primase/polymerase [Actinocrinis sp.]